MYITKFSAEAALVYLRGIASTLPIDLKWLCMEVLDDPRFAFSFGGKTGHHHSYVGGLAIHTAEVMEWCVVAGRAGTLNLNVLLPAAIWHDYMKTRAYRENDLGDITYTHYHDHIGHLSGGALEFYKSFQTTPNVDVDAILHCLLSHHGRREWGAAVEPQSPEALTLHWADMMSANA